MRYLSHVRWSTYRIGSNIRLVYSSAFNILDEAAATSDYRRLGRITLHSDASRTEILFNHDPDCCLPRLTAQDLSRTRASITPPPPRYPGFVAKSIDFG